MTLTIPADDMRRLLEERDHLRRQRDELQATCTRLERDARIGRARAEYWRSMCLFEVHENNAETMADDGNDDGAGAARQVAQWCHVDAVNALGVLKSYGVDRDGEPLP